ncbi:phosphopantetheine-binding protein, partial [Paenibacillus odorifer]
PSYMIPSYFIQIEHIPLLSNGKIDRNALRIEDPEGKDSESILPRDVKEKLLYDIWAEILVTEKIGVKDNFFEIGGDSILSSKMVAKAHNQGLHFTIKNIFEEQSLERIAKVASYDPLHNASSMEVKNENIKNIDVGIDNEDLVRLLSKMKRREGTL